MIIPVKGLKQLDDNDYECNYFYNDELLSNGIYFKNMTTFEETNGEDNTLSVSTMLKVVFYEEKEVDDESFIDKTQWMLLYWDDHLEPIQLYRVIKDIYDLYLDNSTQDFYEIMKGLAVALSSTNMNQRDIEEAEMDLDYIYSNDECSCDEE
jgi:hypothetical protein